MCDRELQDDTTIDLHLLMDCGLRTPRYASEASKNVTGALITITSMRKEKKRHVAKSVLWLR